MLDFEPRHSAVGWGNRQYHQLMALGKLHAGATVGCAAATGGMGETDADRSAAA